MTIYTLLKDNSRFPWLGSRVYLEGAAKGQPKQPYAVIAVDEDSNAEVLAANSGQLTEATCTVTLIWPRPDDGSQLDDVLLSNYLKGLYELIQTQVDNDLHGLMVRESLTMEGGPKGPYNDEKKLGQMWGAIRFSYMVNRLKR